MSEPDPNTQNILRLAVRAEILAQEASGAPLDPKTLAQARRESGDPRQLDWDKTGMPAAMLRALVADRGADPAILIPPSRFMDEMTKLLHDRGGQLDPAILNGTLRTMAKQVVKGNFDQACFFLRHAWGGIRVDGSSDQLLADFVRELFPVAPGTWGPSMGTGRTLLGSRRRLPMQNIPIPKQAINLPPKDIR